MANLNVFNLSDFLDILLFENLTFQFFYIDHQLKFYFFDTIKKKYVRFLNFNKNFLLQFFH